MHKTECNQSLIALSVGDAAGENQQKLLPVIYHGGCWPWTDDTAMAIGVVRTLYTHGTINELELVNEFFRNYRADCNRGYGQGTYRLLETFRYAADDWEINSKNWWGPNNGSKGNGSAMRVTPLGAFYGFNLPVVALEAEKSAKVTHWHEEAIAGAVAAAIATAVATFGEVKDYWQAVLDYTPWGTVRERIALVSGMTANTNWQVVGAVGNGSKVTCVDTVPFALWQAHQALLQGSFEDAINSVIEVGGDTDTVAAIVGGIIGNRVPPSKEWVDRTEPLPADLR
jgi:ADP-ribosylglycohydrolase